MSFLYVKNLTYPVKMAACTVDDMLSKIGQFGRAQKRFYVMIGFVQFTLACQYYLATFAEYSGLDWSCVSVTDHYTRYDHATVPLEERCALLESGQCFPDFTSSAVTTVTEVRSFARSLYGTHARQQQPRYPPPPPPPSPPLSPPTMHIHLYHSTYCCRLWHHRHWYTMAACKTLFHMFESRRCWHVCGMHCQTTASSPAGGFQGNRGT